MLARVRMLAGELTVTSERGAGTTWRVILPAAALDVSERVLLAPPPAATGFDAAS